MHKLSCNGQWETADWHVFRFHLFAAIERIMRQFDCPLRSWKISFIGECLVCSADISCMPWSMVDDRP